jgi:hypothetical protein
VRRVLALAVVAVGTGRDDLCHADMAAARTRGVAAGRSAQRACERSSDWRRGAAGSPDPEHLPGSRDPEPPQPDPEFLLGSLDPEFVTSAPHLLFALYSSDFYKSTFLLPLSAGAATHRKEGRCETTN